MGWLTLTNDLIAGNHANTPASHRWPPRVLASRLLNGRLLHATIADNGGEGDGAQGVHVGAHLVLTMTNTIVARHNGPGRSSPLVAPRPSKRRYGTAIIRTPLVQA